MPSDRAGCRRLRPADLLRHGVRARRVVAGRPADGGCGTRPRRRRARAPSRPCASRARNGSPSPPARDTSPGAAASSSRGTRPASAGCRRATGCPRCPSSSCRTPRRRCGPTRRRALLMSITPAGRKYAHVNSSARVHTSFTGLPAALARRAASIAHSRRPGRSAALPGSMQELAPPGAIVSPPTHLGNRRAASVPTDAARAPFHRLSDRCTARCLSALETSSGRLNQRRRHPLLKRCPLPHPELHGVDNPPEPVVIIRVAPLDQQPGTAQARAVRGVQHPAMASRAVPEARALGTTKSWADLPRSRRTGHQVDEGAAQKGSTDHRRAPSDS